MAFRFVNGQELCQRDHVIAQEADVFRVQGRRRCRRCHNERNGRSARKMTAERRTQRPPVPCLRCGTEIDQTAGRPRIYCSKRCKNGATMSDYKHRAQKYGRRYEQINRLRIFNRDGWVCGLCHEPVDRKLDGLDPWGPTLDHIVPFAEGGDHVESNVQLAHRACNVVKQNTTPEEFRRWLYGPAAEEVA